MSAFAMTKHDLQTKRLQPPSRGVAPGSEASIVQGEFILTEDDFKDIATMVHQVSGIVFSKNKATLLYSRLAKRLRTLGLSRFSEYCDLVKSKQGAEERQEMLAALTTNVTRFFREPHHFAHLSSQVLPALLARAKAGGRVRLWSAACSSGQEPYSIAMSILGLMPNAADYNIKILATDIDPNMLAQGKEGIYSQELMNGVAPEQIRRWMEPVKTQSGTNGFAVGSALRSLVSFRELNLIGQWPMRGQFDVIFCRNVVIYFEESTQAQIWSRFVSFLNPEGRLYIGHSERVLGPAASQFTGDGLTTYRLKEGA